MATRAWCRAGVLVLMVAWAGCAQQEKTKPAPVRDYGRPLPPGQLALVKITHPSRIPDFRPAFGRMIMLGEALDRSLNYFQHPSSQSYYPYGQISHDRAVATLHAFKGLLGRVHSAAQLQDAVVRDFEVYQSVGCDGKGTVLLTGYCQPIYDASLKLTATFRYPLYSRPPDLVTDPADGRCLGRRTRDGLVPYYTRQEIETKDILRDLELVYLKDRLEAYIVHVQGSARLRLPDGRMFEVGYHGKTDRPYASVADALIKDGKINRNERSLSRIKEHFKEHPKDLDRYLYKNEGYVFFRETVGGPYGSLGVPVTPYHTLATDKKIYPRGCLTLVISRVPTTDSRGEPIQAPFTGFVLDQDTGGAIRAPGRADLFLGTGPRAEQLAGHTVSEGTLFYIFLRPELVGRHLAPPSADAKAQPGSASPDVGVGATR